MAQPAAKSAVELARSSTPQQSQAQIPLMPARRRPLREIMTWERLARIVSLPLFLGLWQWVSSAGFVNAMLFPPPTVVVTSFLDWMGSGLLWSDLGMSLSRIAVGFASGAVVGATVGIITGRFRLIEGLLTPVFSLLRPIPPIAFVPLVILWFGLSEWGKYFLVFWGVFFTVWMAAHLGVQKVNPLYIRAAQCLGTPEHKMLTQIYLPGSLPYILVGLRTAVSIAFYALVAAEIAGTFSGIFYRIDISQQNLQVGHAMAGLLVLGALSLIADRTFNAITKRYNWAD
ncbi:ABC transporter permease [Hydrocarboniclastica marina]|nr:ABC transporter permease [Hydrocarboniclastica marina]